MLQSEMLELVEQVQDSLILDYPFLSEWSVGYDHAKKRAGACKFDSKKIVISLSHIELNSEEVVTDTLLHEFAHAIAYQLYRDSGHGSHWKSIAVKIGASPRSRGNFKLPDAPWQVVLCCHQTETLEKVASRHRRNKKIAEYSLKGRPETHGQLFYLSSAELDLFESGKLSFSELSLYQ
jgi:predicted SprT family Zn-dependent metalloprotease